MHILICLLFQRILSLELPYFYHKTSEILNELLALTETCEYLSHIETSSIHTFYLSSFANCSALLIFGEHPRELISTELGFYMIKDICDGNNDILNYAEIFIIVNANPSSREKVEDGDYCLRRNLNGVDTNRN